MKKGFTLIELLVAVSIVGLLMAGATVAYSQVNVKSRNTKRVSDLEQVRSSLELYKSDAADGKYINSGGGIFRANSEGLLDALTPTYMSVLPTDSKSTTQDYYYIANPNSAYQLCAKMEGTAGLPTGTCTCSDGAYNYCVQNP